MPNHYHACFETLKKKKEYRASWGGGGVLAIGWCICHVAPTESSPLSACCCSYCSEAVGEELWQHINIISLELLLPFPCFWEMWTCVQLSTFQSETSANSKLYDMLWDCMKVVCFFALSHCSPVLLCSSSDPEWWKEDESSRSSETSTRLCPCPSPTALSSHWGTICLPTLPPLSLPQSFSPPLPPVVAIRERAGKVSQPL